MPYMVGVGNHEQDHIFGGSKDPSGAPGDGWHPWWGNYLDDSGGECGVPMFYRFHMPDNGNGLWWYVVSLTFYHFYHNYHALLMSSLVSRSCSKPCTYPSGWEHSKMLLFSQSLKYGRTSPRTFTLRTRWITMMMMMMMRMMTMIISSLAHINWQLVYCSKSYLT